MARSRIRPQVKFLQAHQPLANAGTEETALRTGDSLYQHAREDVRLSAVVDWSEEVNPSLQQLFRNSLTYRDKLGILF